MSDARWERMPAGRDKVLGFSRGAIYRFVRDERVRGRRVVQPGSTKGASFFSRTDLEALIENGQDLGAELKKESATL